MCNSSAHHDVYPEQLEVERHRVREGDAVDERPETPRTEGRNGHGNGAFSKVCCLGNPSAAYRFIFFFGLTLTPNREADAVDERPEALRAKRRHGHGNSYNSIHMNSIHMNSVQKEKRTRE